MLIIGEFFEAALIVSHIKLYTNRIALLHTQALQND